MKEKMLKKEIWEQPICIEKKYWLILDGHHRYNVAKQLGIKYIPCELFDYNDTNLLVWSLRKDLEVTKEFVIDRAISNNIYPYKTAKHKFPYTPKKCMLPLNILFNDIKSSNDIIEYK